MGKQRSSIRNFVRALRFRAGEMTQAALAMRVGVARQTIMAIEQGRYSPSLEVAFRIAAVFGVPLERAFRYEQDKAEGAEGGHPDGQRRPSVGAINSDEFGSAFDDPFEDRGNTSR